jgi:uncharacterized protein YbjT (DUF2867 family)
MYTIMGVTGKVGGAAARRAKVRLASRRVIAALVR